MQCPKCGAGQPAENAICERCGIVFEKYYKYHPRPGDAPAPTPTRTRAANFAPRPAPGRSALADLVLPETQRGGQVALAGRALLWVVLAGWGLTLMLSSVESNAAGESFLHLINLPFHEFGHLLFRPFGQYMASLGGTLGQLLMPAICFGVLLVQTRDPFGASAALWWFGENFLDIAPYINDARAGDAAPPRRQHRPLGPLWLPRLGVPARARRACCIWTTPWHARAICWAARSCFWPWAGAHGSCGGTTGSSVGPTDANGTPRTAGGTASVP